MTREKIVEDIKNILGEMAGVAPEQVTEETSLFTELDVDSLLLLELIVALNGHFEIQLPKKELCEQVEYVSDIVTYVEKGFLRAHQPQ